MSYLYQRIYHPDKINKETSALNYTVDQKDLTDTYRMFHSSAAESKFFSSNHETFFKEHPGY
jgi:hypothetical protein